MVSIAEQHSQKLLISEGANPGVIRERFVRGRRIELETEEQVMNDAADRGLEIAEGTDWLAKVAQHKDFPTYSRPPHVNCTDFIQLENQGAIGSCFGVSGASVADWMEWIRTGETGANATRFSGFWHYLKTQEQDNLLGQDKGSVPTSGWVVAQKIGFVPRSAIARKLHPDAIKAWGGIYPRNYKEGYQQYAPLLRDKELLQLASIYTVGSLVALRKPEHVVEFITLGNGGVQQCSPWVQEFDRRDDNNYIARFQGGNRKGMHGHHAYYISGYNTNKECNIFNSWGEQFGDEGGKTISRSAHQECLDHKQTYCVGQSKFAMTANPPKPVKAQWKGKNVL